MALMEHPTVSEAARASGVGLRSLQQWINHHDSFKLHYRNARRQAFTRTLKSVQDQAPNIIACVFTIASSPDTPCTARVMATRLLLDLSHRGTQLLEQAEQIEADLESLSGTERKRLGGALENKAFHDKWREREEKQRAKAEAQTAQNQAVQEQPDSTS